MTWLIRPFRMMLKAVLGEAKAGQLALGFAFGLWIGMVPKGNLTAIALGVIMASTRANLGIATATILLTSLASLWLDPLFDGVGAFLLSHPALQGVWTQLYNLPVMPWTGFNNSIVLGSFLIGLILVYPSYHYSKPWLKKYSEVVGKWARRYWLTRLLMGVEWADRLTVTGA